MEFRSRDLLRRASEKTGAGGDEVQSETAQSPQRPPRIVIVQSPFPTPENVAEIIRRLGFEVLLVQDKDTALRLIDRYSPDVVFSWSELPSIQGYADWASGDLGQKRHSIPITLVAQGRNPLPPGSTGKPPASGHESPASPPSLQRPAPGLDELLKLLGQPPSPEPLLDAEATDKRVDTNVPPRVALDLPAADPGSLADLLAQLNQRRGRGSAEETSLVTSLGELEDLDIERLFREPLLRPDAATPAHSPESAGDGADRRTGPVHEPADGEPVTNPPLTDSSDLTAPLQRAAPGPTWPPASDQAGQEAATFPELGRTVSDLDKPEKPAVVQPSAFSSAASEPAEQPRLVQSPATEGPIQSLSKRARPEEIASFLEALGPAVPKNRESESDVLLYLEAQGFVLESIRAASEGGSPDLEKAEQVTSELLRSLSSDRLLLRIATAREQEFAVSTHCVNVSILALHLGMTLGKPGDFLQRIGVAALLHEVGVVKLPPALVYRTDQISEHELQLMRHRPVFSARILEGCGSGLTWLKEAVGQVFEREDGSGFPVGLAGAEICEEGKILGICDYFEACIHRRPYRQALTAHQALFLLTTKEVRRFADWLTRGLLHSLTLYPYNEYVLLSTGEIGGVVEINPGSLSRPVVVLLSDPRGVALPEGKTVDLSREQRVYVVKAVPPDELPRPAARHQETP